jgi:GMP synthase (glutamine-hydrolysing)
MTARIHFLEHSEHDVPGVLGRLALDRGWEVGASRADRGASSLPTVGSFDVLVVLGSDESTLDPTVDWIGPERTLVSEVVAAGTPVLGVCFGGQLLAQVLGGEVSRATRKEIGWRAVGSADPVRLPSGPWLVWHEDAFTAPPGSESLAWTDVSLQAFVSGVHTGVQFHPEVTREIVGDWVDVARSRGHLDPGEAQALLDGFDAGGRGPDEQTAQLFDSFVERTGLGARSARPTGAAPTGRGAEQGRKG